MQYHLKTLRKLWAHAHLPPKLKFLKCAIFFLSTLNPCSNKDTYRAADQLYQAYLNSMILAKCEELLIGCEEIFLFNHRNRNQTKNLKLR